MTQGATASRTLRGKFTKEDMDTPMIRALARFAWVITACVSLHAQNANTITVKLLEGKNGAPVTPSNFEVRIDRQDAAHNEWVRMNDDGTAVVSIPADAKQISIQATYDSSMETFVNCDAAKEKDRYARHWYAIADILKTGMVTPNECGKTRTSAKPGEFIFYARKRDWRDLPTN
jgi:hypothetical protein